jgi:NADH-quinone oxidoreductase subunit L
LFQGIAALVTLSGIYLGYVLYNNRLPAFERPGRVDLMGRIHRFWYSGWGFDTLYDRLVVRPFVRLAQLNRQDLFDQLYTGIAGVNMALHRALSFTQSGSLRWYAMGLLIGSMIVFGIQLII